MLFKETINNADDDNRDNAKDKPKRKGIFSSFLKSVAHEHKKIENSSGNKPSFYDSPSGFFEDDEFDDLDTVTPTSSKPKAFNFNWWEYAIILIELLLLIYAILVFLNQVPIF